MAAIQQYHIKALTPTWFLVKLTPALASREGGIKRPASGATYSPLLLSPAVWQKAQDEKKDKDGAERAGGLPESPRISCMGQVKGRTGRGCSSARSPAPRGSGNRAGAGPGGGGGKVATLCSGCSGGGTRGRRARAPRSGTCPPGAPAVGAAVQPRPRQRSCLTRRCRW